jgi:hypothetical protein
MIRRDLLLALGNSVTEMHQNQKTQAEPSLKAITNIFEEN